MSSMTMLGANDETPALRTVDAQVTEKDKSNIQGLEEGQKLSGKGAGDNDLVWTKEEERKVLRKVDLAIVGRRDNGVSSGAASDPWLAGRPQFPRRQIPWMTFICAW